MQRSFTQSLHKALDQLQESMFDAIGSFYIKDRSGAFLVGNRTQLRLLDMKNPQDLLGKRAKETPFAKYADRFAENDAVVLKNNKLTQFFEYAINGQGELLYAVSHKRPFYHRDQLVGICGLSLLLPSHQLNNASVLSDKTEFIDTRQGKVLCVSEQRRESLFYLLQGLSIKAIAERRGLSHRTVEHHLEHFRETNGYASLKDVLLHVRVI